MPASGADMPHDTELGQNISTAARRIRGWFVRWMVVDAERLMIWYHEPGGVYLHPPYEPTPCPPYGGTGVLAEFGVMGRIRSRG